MGRKGVARDTKECLVDKAGFESGTMPLIFQISGALCHSYVHECGMNG
jgi:hypothetical protein